MQHICVEQHGLTDTHEHMCIILKQTVYQEHGLPNDGELGHKSGCFFVSDIRSAPELLASKKI